MNKFVFMTVAVLGLFANQAFAKTAAKAEQTLSTGAPSMDSLKGLSAVIAYDFADEAEPKQGSNIETEKSFAIGAQYEFSQFYPGVGWQIGGLYELSKDIEDSNGAKYKNLTGYVEVVGKVTPKIKVFGGINYTNPDLSNDANGGKLKGDMGFQGGATYLATNNFAVDVRYRSIRMEYSVSGFDQFGAPVSVKTDIKSDGLMFAGRYMF